MLVETLEVTLLVLLFAILAGPIIADRFRIPGLLGLIFFGMLFGAYVLRRVPITDQLKPVRRMAQVDLAVVAGPNRISVGRRTTPHRMEGLLGTQQ